jgi:hypothetical protein
MIHINQIRGFVRRLAPTLYLESKSLDPKAMILAKRLCPNNYGRSLVLSEFIANISSTFSRTSKLNVAVIGGSSTEPEILVLAEMGFIFESTMFGIEENTQYLDLNQPPQNYSFADFDLVLCSQVWEHIWHHGNAFENIKNLMSSGSYLWLAAPASNRAHSSPDYFCAGFTSSYFSNNLKFIGFSVLATGQLGSVRNYRATHSLPIWLSVRSHNQPLLNTFSGSNILARFVITLRYLLRNIELYFFSRRVSDDISFATESWVFAKKK